MVSPTPVLIPAGRYVGTTITPLQLALPYMYGEDCGPMWTRKEWKAVHPDAAKVAKQKEEDMLRKAKLRALVRAVLSPIPALDRLYRRVHQRMWLMLIISTIDPTPESTPTKPKPQTQAETTPTPPKRRTSTQPRNLPSNQGKS